MLFIGLVGTGVFAYAMGTRYPVELWLFWKLLKLWGWLLLFNLGCLGFGHFVCQRVLRLRSLPALEASALAMSTGVVAFAMFMYLGGALAWFRPWFAIALPSAMFAVGALDLKPLAARLRHELYTPESRSLLDILIGAAGVICVGIVYLGVLSPDAINYDAAWCHQVVAQEYARNGRIVAFLADYNRSVPHLASILYTWSYVLPGMNFAQRIMLALHTEFALWLWTLVSVSAAMRTILDRQTLRRGWVSFFLFPIIFVYDSTLGGASDHVCGFFAIPIGLAALRCCETWRRGAAALLAIQCAGAVLTKLQALFLVTPAILVCGGVWLCWLARKREHLRELLSAPAIIGGVFFALISPHLIRQYVFHNNPLYPFLQDVFKASTPTVPNGAFLVANAVADPLYQPQGNFFEKLWHALELFWTFSFVPHYSFTRQVPAFGSLFTLLFPTLIFVRNARLTLMAAFAAGAVLIWGMVYNIDRNLQAFMPLLVCVTGALIVSWWRAGWIARSGLIPLLAVQIVWGGDALFYSQQERLNQGMDLIRTGFEGEAHKRFARYRHEYLAMSRALPPDARVLLHNSHGSLGILREVLLDVAGFQGLIHYDHITTPRGFYSYLRALGITHLIDDMRGSPASTAQEQAIWDAFITGWGRPIGEFEGYRMYRMPDGSPPEQQDYRVGLIHIDSYADGIYDVKQLHTMRFLPADIRAYEEPRAGAPADRSTWPEFFAQAEVMLVAHDVDLEQPTQRLLRKRYVTARTLDHDFTVYVRRTAIDRR